MTVILPGMTEDDQRVKISSADPKQQGIMDLWKGKVGENWYFNLCWDIRELNNQYIILRKYPRMSKYRLWRNMKKKNNFQLLTYNSMFIRIRNEMKVYA